MLSLVVAAGASAATVVNGDFESGSLSGWSLEHSANNYGENWYAYSGTTSPASGFPVPAPPQGTWAALTDQNGPSHEILYQDVVLEPGLNHKLSFTAYYDNRNDSFYTPNTLDSATAPNQQYRVDVTKPASSNTSVAAADVLTTPFKTNVGDALQRAPFAVCADLSSFAGQTVRLRFAVTQTQYYFNAGVDSVAITSGTGPVDPACVQPPAGDCTITGTAGDDVLKGTKGDDVICGLGGRDQLIGRSGNDTLIGGDGNDVLLGGKGNDSLDGGNDMDTAGFYDSSIDGASVDLVDGTAVTNGGGSDSLANIENVKGSAGSDTLIGNAGINILRGRGGDDFVYGGEGDDQLTGDDGDDVVDGQGGNDYVQPGDGSDEATGGTGGETNTGDFLIYPDADSGVLVDIGANTTGGGAAGDTISGFESLTGSPFGDVLTAHLGGIRSILKGYAGDDTIAVDDGDSVDVARGGAGTDSCTADPADSVNC
jgi:Ca2+-binding RTX toxin-like protein